jgi:Tfp pilus assembly protein PilO
MKQQSTKTALAIAGLIVLAGAFWLLLLGPKREKADKLGEQATTLRSEVVSEQQRSDEALAAKHRFPSYYRHLVVLGKAVPAEAATPSLLVQLNGISGRSRTAFQSIALGGSEGEGTTEETAGALPIGAGTGPAGLASLSYSLKVGGGFFRIADFVHGIDSLVKTRRGIVDANGRLIAIDGFNLAPTEDGDRQLTGNFSVTTYVTPPGQGLTAGATSAGPVTETGVE